MLLIALIFDLIETIEIHKVVQKWSTRVVQIDNKDVGINFKKIREHFWRILIMVFCILYNYHFTYCALHI